MPPPHHQHRHQSFRTILSALRPSLIVLNSTPFNNRSSFVLKSNTAMKLSSLTSKNSRRKDFSFEKKLIFFSSSFVQTFFLKILFFRLILQRFEFFLFFRFFKKTFFFDFFFSKT